MLEQAAGNKAPWAQTLSFVHPCDPAFADANPTASLAKLQSVLHTTALGFLWDTDRLPGGPEACCKEPQCSATREKGITRDSFVEKCHVSYAAGGKKLYIFGLKLRCTFKGELSSCSPAAQLSRATTLINVACLTCVVRLAVQECTQSQLRPSATGTRTS
jgi:hypothetical protein